MEENSTGAVTARLATDATLVKAMAGENQGRVVQNAFTLISALLIAFILGSWKVTLVLLSMYAAISVRIAIRFVPCLHVSLLGQTGSVSEVSLQNIYVSVMSWWMSPCLYIS
jgi:ABC-type multidrug transport system fused ATPase/permease subunit